MRTIYSLLAEIEKIEISDMDLTEDLVALQTILGTFNDHVKPFRNIPIIEENERYVAELKTRISYFLKQRGFWDTNTDTPSLKQDHQNILRKIVLFLLYNTETDANEIVESGPKVSHLVGNFPRPTKCVLFYLVRELKLFPYFCEFVQYGRSDLVAQFLDCELLNSVKQMDNCQRLEILPLLISGVYNHCFLAGFTVCEDKETREDHFEKINDFLATLLLSHVHADREKFPGLKKGLEFDTYIGQMMRHTLRPIIRCLETFLSRSIEPPVDRDVFPLFQIDTDRELLGKYSPDEFLDEYLASLNSLLLNRVQMVLMTVSCNTFLNWVEVDLNKSTTLQRAVGELAHRLMNILEENEELKHDIHSILKGVAVKPLKAEEIAREANITEIILHIEDKEERNRRIWMKEFLTRGLFVLDNEECLSVIAEHSHLIEINDLKHLTDFLKDNVGTELSCLPQIVEVIAKVLSAAETPKAVEEFLEKEEPFRVLMDFDFFPEKYYQSLTEFLNKLVDLKEDVETVKLSNLSPFITTLVIDPTKTLNEVQNSCIVNTNLVENGLKILGVFKSFVSGYLDEIVSDSLESRVGESNSLKGLELYVVEVFSRGFINKEEFLKNCLFQEIVQNGQEKEKSVETMNLLNILKGILERESFQLTPDLRAPYVVGLAEVADSHRWDLMNYTDTEEKIVSLATELIGVVGRGGEDLQGKHKAFVLHKSQSLKEINRYFIETLFPENRDTTFARYLHPAAFQTDKNRRDFLCKIFVRATGGEKELLADCEDLQPHFIDMMLTITKAIAGHEKLLTGYRGAFTGFLKIFKEKLIDSLEVEIITRFVELVALLPLEIYVEQTFVVNGVIAKILERVRADEEHKRELHEKIRGIPESSAKVHLLQQIQV